MEVLSNRVGLINVFVIASVHFFQFELNSLNGKIRMIRTQESHLRVEKTRLAEVELI